MSYQEQLNGMYLRSLHCRLMQAKSEILSQAMFIVLCIASTFMAAYIGVFFCNQHNIVWCAFSFILVGINILGFFAFMLPKIINAIHDKNEILKEEPKLWQEASTK
jgi:hypothetical protein